MAMGRWRPPVGTTTLVEPADADVEPLTATVLDDDRLLLDVGSSPRPSTETFDAVASFFTPEALLRVTGVMTLTGDDGAVYELVVKDVQRVDRRTSPRVDVELRVAMIVTDAEPPLTLVGHTVNISAGGCRVVTDRPLPAGTEPTVSVELGDGADVVAGCSVLCTEHRASEWDYRLMFTAIDPADRDRIAALAS
jgi:hypothetical protein